MMQSPGNSRPLSARTFNVARGYLGLPGSGKTTRAVGDVLKLARASGAYIVAHDSAWSIPDRLPDGTRVPIVRHQSEESARAGYKSAPGSIHALSTETLAPATRIAVDLAAASGRPAILYVDEIVAVPDTSPNYVTPEFRALLSTRRHANVGIVWTTQSPFNVHRVLLKLSTELVIGRLRDGADLNRLQQSGVPRETIEKLAKLDNYRFIEVRTS